MKAEEVTNEELLKEIQTLKARVAELEAKVAAGEGRPQEQAAAEHRDGIHTHIMHRCPECGIKVGDFKIAASATTVTQMAIDPNNVTGNNHVIDATLGAEIEIEKEIGENGLAHLKFEVGTGNGLDGDELNTWSGVNAKAGNSGDDLQIDKAWYEHYFLDGQLTLTAGRIDPGDYMDQNEIANDDSTQFLAGCFKESPAIEFSEKSYGFRAKAEPLDWLDVEAGTIDDDGDWEDIFEDLFTFAQVNFKPGLFDRDGNYRFYLWYDDSPHTKWSDAGTTTQPNFGFGTSCDQRMLDDLSFFGRFGWEDPDVSTVEWAWSTGFQLEGASWKRERDYIGCAVGMNIPGDDYGDAGFLDEPEGHVEAYYNIYINDNLRITPDYQFIWYPNGDGGAGPINVVGARGQVDF